MSCILAFSEPLLTIIAQEPPHRSVPKGALLPQPTVPRAPLDPRCPLRTSQGRILKEDPRVSAILALSAGSSYTVCHSEWGFAHQRCWQTTVGSGAWCPQEVGLTGGHCGGHRTDCTGSATGGEVLSCPTAPPRPSVHASFHPLTIPPQLSVRLLEVQLSRETVTEGKHDVGGSVRAREGSEPPTLTYPSVSPPPLGAFSDPTRSQAPTLTLPGFHSERPGKTGGL